jgi:protein-tyrosine phosphatase
MEISLKMLRDEAQNGVTAAICTPHHYISGGYMASVEKIQAGFTALKKAAEEENIPVDLYLGQEIYYNTKENIFSMLKNGELLTMNGGKRVLIEFSTVNQPRDVADIVYEASAKGYEVIVAHVERYKWITPELVAAMKSEGALIQVNASSVIGGGWRDWKKRAFVKKLMESDLVDFIASDIHSFRPCMMAEALKKTKRRELFEYDFS